MGGGMGRPQAPPTQNANAATTTATATAQLLAMANVQKDLALTTRQLSQLSQIVRAANAQGSSESAVRAAVAKALSEAQANRLTELLIQYLGYGALTLSDVRAKLDLTAEQHSSIVEIFTSADQAKKALQSNATNPGAAAQVSARLQAETNQRLARVLTPQQDAALRKLAGRAIGS